MTTDQQERPDLKAVEEDETHEEEQDALGKLQEDIETIEPRYEKREWQLVEYEWDSDRGGFTDKVVAKRKYIQGPLSFFGKLELTGKLGEALDVAMSGPDPLTLNTLLAGVSMARGDQLTAQDFMDADSFVKLFARVMSYAPELIAEVYCIVLQIPRNERSWARDVMARREEDGGLSDDDGFLIAETFLDQNGEVLKDFFALRIQPLFQRARKRLGSTSEEPSKPSKPTRRRTQKR